MASQRRVRSGTGGFFRFEIAVLEPRTLLSAGSYTDYLTDFTKTNNIYTNLNEEFPHTGAGAPGSGVGVPNATFLFDPTPSAVAAAGYAPDYVSGSNLVNNGIDFNFVADASGHDFDEINGGQTTTIAANLSGVQTVYALMGAYNGQSFTATFTGADGTTQVFSDVSVPDFNGGSINITGSNPTDQTVFQVRNVGAGGSGNSTTGDYNTYDLTEVTFTLQASLTSQVLSSIAFSSNGYMTLLLGVTATGASAPPVKTIGGLDPGFGANGLASHNVGFTATNGVATDGTQSVLIGPIGVSPSEEFGLTRYNGDGSLDSTFGTGGVVATSFNGTDDVPTAVQVLAGGNILVGGTATTYTGGVVSGSEFAVAEYTPSGVLDSSFGNGGLMLVSFSSNPAASSNDLLRAMAVSSSGVIYLAGSTDAAGAGNTDLALAALTPAGSLDPGFGSGGKTRVDVAGGDDVINSIAIQRNGDVVAAGSAVVGGTSEVVIARFLASGKLDSHFGDKGLVTGSVGGVYDVASSVVIQSNGEIVVGGLTASGTAAAPYSDFLLQRYTAAGRLDRTFGNAGTVTTDFGQPAAVTQVVLQSNGEIVASGKTTPSLTSVTANTLDVAVARYTTRGVLDTTFDGTGKAIVDLGAGEIALPTLVLHADASSLGAAFNVFTASAQGVVTVTQGGEILDAGNSGMNTVEAELIAAGVDLLTKLLSAVPASALGGAKATATISISENGTDPAAGTVTVSLELASDASGTGAVTVKSVSERINLKQSQSRSYRLAFTYPTTLANGNYYLLASVADGPTLNDLNTSNNTAASSSAVTLAAPTITLNGSDLSALSALTPGKVASFEIDLTNVGNVVARGRTSVELLLSANGDSTGAEPLASVPITVNLPPLTPRVYRLSVKIPTTVTAGASELLATVDPTSSLGSADVSDTLAGGGVVTVT